MATTGARRVFVDTNVLIRATINRAPLHAEARAHLDRLWDEGAALYISQQVLREYMVNTTRLQSYSPALPMSAVVGQVRAFQDSFYVLHSSPGVLDHLLRLAERVRVAGKQIHDANIVATMLAYDISDLLTHNTADFVRYSDWITLIAL